MADVHRLVPPQNTYSRRPSLHQKRENIMIENTYERNTICTQRSTWWTEMHVLLQSSTYFKPYMKILTRSRRKKNHDIQLLVDDCKRSQRIRWTSQDEASVGEIKIEGTSSKQCSSRRKCPRSVCQTLSSRGLQEGPAHTRWSKTTKSKPIWWIIGDCHRWLLYSYPYPHPPIRTVRPRRPCWNESITYNQHCKQILTVEQFGR